MWTCMQVLLEAGVIGSLGAGVTNELPDVGYANQTQVNICFGLSHACLVLPYYFNLHLLITVTLIIAMWMCGLYVYQWKL